MFSSKSLILSVTAYRHTFQSLFSWMFSSKSEPVALGLLGIKFQSLFSWMFSSKPTAAVRLHVLNLCFNPCSLGCFPRRIERISLILSSSSFNPCSLGCFPRRGRSTAHRRYIDRFQSLFSWMFSSKIWNDKSFTPEPESFNPCSLGCFPRSRSRNRLRLSRNRVSILVLLDVFLEVSRPDCSKLESFVSILVLLDVFLEVYEKATYIL